MSALVERPARRVAPAAAEAASAIPYLAAIVAVAVLIQVRCGAIGDVSWLITVDEHWLSGAKPYVDIIETNPPSALFLYWPAVALARATGLPAEALVAATGFAAAGGALALAYAILKGANLARRFGSLPVGVALAVATILPGRSFDERDFFAALAGAPIIAAATARASRRPVSIAHALAAGVGAGVMAALKPPYALALLSLAPYIAARIGLRRALAAIEYWVAAAVVVAFIGLAATAFPAYVANVAPTVVSVYAPARLPFEQLVANAGVLFGLLVAVSVVAIAGRRAMLPSIAAPAIAALGAFAGFFLQGKGWLYQAYPGLAYLGFAFAAALGVRRGSPSATAMMASVSLTAACGALVFDSWPLQIGMIAAVAGFAVLATRIEPLVLIDERKRRESFGRMAAAASFGVLSALYLHAPDGEGDPTLARALMSLGPHPTVASISESLGVGFPLTRQVGARWAQRTQGMLMAAAARYRIARNPGDAALKARMQAAIDADRDLVVADIARNKPDAVLVGPTNTRFYAWAAADPKIVAAMADYRRFAANGDKTTPLEVWARKDLIGLRPEVGEGMAR